MDGRLLGFRVIFRMPPSGSMLACGSVASKNSGGGGLYANLGVLQRLSRCAGGRHGSCDCFQAWGAPPNKTPTCKSLILRHPRKGTPNFLEAPMSMVMGLVVLSRVRC